MSAITGSMLYSYVQCPHRVWLDQHGDAKVRDEESAFVEFLWRRGVSFEHEIIQGLKKGAYLDLSAVVDAEEKERQTLAAMREKRQLVYSGRIRHGNLVGQPDLLRLHDKAYVAGDIKSGAGKEGDGTSEGKLKKHYAVQLALYTDVLDKLGYSAGRHAFVWDGSRKEVKYDFDKSQGPRTPQTFWAFYEETLKSARNVLKGRTQTKPAMASVCKLCHWHSYCKAKVAKTDDLTKISELGRSARDTLVKTFPTVAKLAKADLSKFITKDKTSFTRIGAKTLQKYQLRARLLADKDAKACLTAPVQLPKARREIFFDIEDDPMRGVVYLHGFVVRSDKEIEFTPFVAKTADAEGERVAFADAIGFLKKNSTASVYVYSGYEKTAYEKLQKRYPNVVSAEFIDALFSGGRVTDLYDVVRTSTEWPTWDKSIKTLAKYLKFEWRDTNPSGAASIEWYNQFVMKQDDKLLRRILDYNEDDCRAMYVLLDGLRAMQPSETNPPSSSPKKPAN